MEKIHHKNSFVKNGNNYFLRSLKTLKFHFQNANLTKNQSKNSFSVSLYSPMTNKDNTELKTNFKKYKTLNYKNSEFYSKNELSKGLTELIPSENDLASIDNIISTPILASKNSFNKNIIDDSKKVITINLNKNKTPLTSTSKQTITGFGPKIQNSIINSLVKKSSIENNLPVL